MKKAFRKLVNKLYIVRRQIKYKPKIKSGYRKDDPFIEKDFNKKVHQKNKFD